MAEKGDKVQKGWDDLKAASKDRLAKLEAASLSQKYYVAADDAERFIHEKEPLLESTDVGQDEESAHALLKKHQALHDELESFEFDINALRAMSKTLVERNNHESPLIAKRQEEIEDLWGKLKKNSHDRKRALEEADKYHKFNRDAEELAMWIGDKEVFVKEAQLSQELDVWGPLLLLFPPSWISFSSCLFFYVRTLTLSSASSRN